MNNLDRLVGVKVFGWSIVTDSDGEPIWSNDCGTPLAFQYASAPVKFGPNFSTEIAAAWEVVRKLRDVKHTEPEWNERWDWAFAIHSPQHCQHWATFYKCGPGDIVKDDSKVIATACGGTEGEAICRAALLAVGVPESEIQEAMR
jgi:hypothetical protein